MAKKFLTPIDLTKNEILNGVFQQLASAPSTPVQGQFYYNTSDDTVYVWDGGAWLDLGSNIAGSDDVTNDSTVSGATVSDALETLDSDIADVASDVADHETRISDVETELPNKADTTYVDNLVQGLSWKDSVRVASVANVNISNGLENGDAIDGVTLATGDRVLLRAQTDAKENGVYVVVASGAASRAPDVNSSAEIKGMTVYVEEGSTYADTVWTLTTNAPTLGTDNLAYAQVNGGAVPQATTTTQGKVELATQAETQAKTDTDRAVTPAGLADFTRKYAANIGDGSSVQIDVTHNLGSKDVVVAVRQNSDDAEVECDVTMLNTTQVRLDFAVAPASNALRVTVVG